MRRKIDHDEFVYLNKAQNILTYLWREREMI